MAEAEAAGNAFAAHDTKTTLSALQQVRKQRDNGACSRSINLIVRTLSVCLRLLPACPWLCRGAPTLSDAPPPSARAADPKVLHNLAIAEYMDGGQRDPRKLLNTLEGLKQRLEDARSEAEFGEGDALGDTDPSLTAYNMAVLLYQQKQYARCRTLLEDMFTNIEPIDEFLAFKLCFLLLDVYLLQRQAERAAEVLAQLEKSYAALTKMDGDKQNGEAEGAAVGATGATGGADGKGAAGEDWPNKRSSRRPPTDITPEEVRSALSLYKAKLALMARSSKSSKREIKTTLNACAQNTTGLFLKCNLEWQRQNYRKAIKLLNNSCQTTEREKNVSALYFNNMGCIHHCMRRHQAAAFYFTRALQENDTLYSDAKGECTSPSAHLSPLILPPPPPRASPHLLGFPLHCPTAPLLTAPTSSLKSTCAMAALTAWRPAVPPSQRATLCPPSAATAAASSSTIAGCSTSSSAAPRPRSPL